jgi:hypothetical protein
MTPTVRLIAAFDDALSLLAEAVEAPLEVRYSLLNLFESGEQIFTIKSNDFVAAVASEVIVRLDPSDRLASLVTALRTGDVDALRIKHIGSPSR